MLLSIDFCLLQPISIHIYHGSHPSGATTTRLGGGASCRLQRLPGPRCRPWGAQTDSSVPGRLMLAAPPGWGHVTADKIRPTESCDYKRSSLERNLWLQTDPAGQGHVTGDKVPCSGSGDCRMKWLFSIIQAHFSTCQEVVQLCDPGGSTSYWKWFEKVGNYAGLHLLYQKSSFVLRVYKINLSQNVNFTSQRFFTSSSTKLQHGFQTTMGPNLAEPEA